MWRLAGYALLVSFWSNEYGGEICAVDARALYEGLGFHAKNTMLRRRL